MAIDGPSYTLPVLGEISPIPLANFWVLSLDPVLFLRDYDDCPISLDSSPLPEWYFISIGCLAPPRLHPGCSATFYTSTPSSPSKLHNPVLLPTLVLGTPALYLPCKVIWTFFKSLFVSPLSIFFHPYFLFTSPFSSCVKLKFSL